MRKIVYLLITLIMIVGLVGCNVSEESTTATEPEIRNFYKTVPVIITEIKPTWALKGNYKWLVRFKSDEYGIEGSDEVSNWDSIGNDIFRGSLNEGDTIEANMWTKKQGETILNRYLSHIIK